MTIKTQIVGNYYLPKESKEAFKGLYNGVILKLEREPQNEYDEYAVKVMYEDYDKMVHIGYIPKEKSELVSSALEMGINLIAVYEGKKDISIEESNLDYNDTEYEFFEDHIRGTEYCYPIDDNYNFDDSVNIT